MSTRLSLRDLRADALHRLLLTPRGAVATAAEIQGLPDLSGWTSVSTRLAVADLLLDGRLVTDDEGTIVTVAPVEGEAVL